MQIAEAERSPQNQKGILDAIQLQNGALGRAGKHLDLHAAQVGAAGGNAFHLNAVAPIGKHFFPGAVHAVASVGLGGVRFGRRLGDDPHDFCVLLGAIPHGGILRVGAFVAGL